MTQLRGLKNKVYTTNPIPKKSETKIYEGILEIPQEELLRVNSNPHKQYRECVHIQGQHFQNLL
jgi:hypothetical protein